MAEKAALCVPEAALSELKSDFPAHGMARSAF